LKLSTYTTSQQAWCWWRVLLLLFWS
jgi:hypothetical protein